MCVVLGQRLAEGFRSLLGWFKSEYGNPPLLVTENGRPDDNVYFDTDRIQFHHVRPIQYFFNYLYEHFIQIVFYSTEHFNCLWTLNHCYETYKATVEVLWRLICSCNALRRERNIQKVDTQTVELLQCTVTVTQLKAGCQVSFL